MLTCRFTKVSIAGSKRFNYSSLRPMYETGSSAIFGKNIARIFKTGSTSHTHFKSTSHLLNIFTSMSCDQQVWQIIAKCWLA